MSSALEWQTGPFSSEGTLYHIYISLNFFNREGSSALVTFSVIDSDGQRGWQEPVVMVTDTGHLLSAGQSGQASLLITSHEDFGVNQSIVILIKVCKPPCQTRC